MLRDWMGRLAAAVVLAVAGATSAFADFASGGANPFEVGTFTDNAGTGYTFTNISAADGTYVFDKTLNDTSGSITFDAYFSAAQSRLTITIYSGTVTNAYLNVVFFTTQSGGAIADNLNNPLTATEGALNQNGATSFTFHVGGASDNYLLTTSGGTFTTWDQVTLTFAFDNSGDSLQFDALETPAIPEPGTFALFALGAAGLGGVAMRRRRARVAAPRRISA
jgi:hypothetical protein